MISILRHNVVRGFAFALMVFFGTPFLVWGQTSQTLSVSPTLFDITASPGQVWQSNLRIINPNNYDLVVYAQVVNFNASGETGQPRFEEVITTETQGQTLAEWVSITTDPITVAQQQAATIPFSVQVPADAVPGGHYAAILIGTRPPAGVTSETGVQTSQFVTALLFLRVDGDVIEAARVKNFTTNERIYQNSDVDLSLRFENTGTVHVQPQGDIVIKNMWGEERGIIPVNQRTQFGKVLRDSTREYEFNWRGDLSFFDIGRYTAEVTLAYGDDEKKFAAAATSFWVIPFTAIALVLGSVITFICIIVFSVRLYVRRMLLLAGVNPDTGKRAIATEPGTIIIGRYGRVTAPLVTTAREMKREWVSAIGLTEKGKRIVKKIVHEYRQVSLIIVAFLLVSSVLVVFRSAVTAPVRDYEVTIYNDDQTVRTVGAEAIIFESLSPIEPVYVRAVRELPEQLTVRIVNVSGTLGTGAAVAAQLQSYGLEISEVSSDFSQRNLPSVILYDPVYTDVALALSQELGGVLISAREDNQATHPDLEIRVNADMVK